MEAAGTADNRNLYFASQTKEENSSVRQRIYILLRNTSRRKYENSVFEMCIRDRSGPVQGFFQGRNKEEKDTKMAEDRESRENEGSMYGYGLEEILPVVIYLTNKYTSGESSSVPYEKAEMLMEAVLYCIRECFTWNKMCIRDRSSFFHQAGLPFMYTKA